MSSIKRNAAAMAFLHAVDPHPPRVWSLIMTVMGDCVIPRSNAIPLTLLGEILSSFGVENSAVRAATSRLTRDRLLTRQRDGRTSIYALPPHALRLSQDARTRIYAPSHPKQDGEWQLALMQRRDSAVRAELMAQGFRQMAPGAFARYTTALVSPTAEVITLTVTHGTAQLAEAAFPLSEIADLYSQLTEQLHILLGAPPDDERGAVVHRIALVHAFRRIALREPALSPVDLPSPWPGFAARAAFLTAHADLSMQADPLLDEWLGPRKGDEQDQSDM